MAELQPLLDSLYQGNALTRDQSAQLFSAIVAGEMDPVAMAGMLVALKMRGETIDEITGAADALRRAAKPFPRSASSLSQGVVDIVGTGGDGHNTINISTTASFVAAAAGAKVTKHGNRGVSSKSGASDVLSHCGIALTMSPESASKCVDDFGLCFLFAPHYHAGVRHAVPVRQALKTRTIFNILGPLINPAKPEAMLLGVYSPKLIAPIVNVLNALGVKRAMVVYGSGLDEVALHGETQVAELNDGKIRFYKLTPQDLGVEPAEIKALEGGEPSDNALITQAILKGEGQPAHRDAVAINAGCALYVSGVCDTVQQGTALALETINSGKAYEVLTQLAAASQQEDAK
ncbi:MULTISPECIES: anthranilate phosphoribosyltransferase [unclassified Shewanella]|uniref:anthranilate phosphoribosyltransferase n=1 Tax=unclassified Shewanella TaxID=196818 RepID=UPI000C82D925|nr:MULTISPECIES: anthranilate phosphoribosyltransferase [unclassified Shewanella]MDO6617764.1 anthranilate phosphoribosyltransferase [Shewanella sp. 6_MG-2023]PMI01690.1 anthranilate phosphoribosyltransferase [Shewanella sp. 10N.286.48.A6]